MDLAIVLPAGDGNWRDATELTGLLDTEEVGLFSYHAVFECVEDLEIFDRVAALVAKSATGGETPGFFPPAERFVREVELGSYFLDCVELVHNLYIQISV